MVMQPSAAPGDAGGCEAGQRATSPLSGKGATFLAEAVGFEPTMPCGITVFKTAAFNHSATPPLEVV